MPRFTKLASTLAVSSCLLAGTVALSAPAAATDGVPCTWTVAMPRTYSIGAATPKVTATGSCVTKPTANPTGPDNWKLYVDLTTGGKVARTILFQGCDWKYRGNSNPNTMCNSVAWSNGEYPVQVTMPLTITTAGTFTTAAESRSYAYDLGDTNGYVTTFKAASTVAKFATTTGLRMTRSGTLRRFTVSPAHYQVGKGYVGSTYTTVYLQRYVSGHWATYKTLRSSRYPMAWSVRLSKTYSWRAVTPATTTRWSSTSRTVKL